MVHVVFNVLGVLICFGLIGPLSQAVHWVSPSASPVALERAAETLRAEMPEVDSLTPAQFAVAVRQSAETPRQIANAHTIFNVSNTLILIWFTGPLTWLVTRLVPDRAPRVAESDKPRYLDDLLLQTPAMAMDIVRMELGRLGAGALRMVNRSLRVVLDGSDHDLRALATMDSDVDRLHGAIVTYLGRLSQEDLSDQQSTQLHHYLGAANYIESIADVVETNLVESGQRRLRNHLQVSESTRQLLSELHAEVRVNVENAFRGLVENDAGAAAQVIKAKGTVSQLADAAEEHLSRRLAADEPHRVLAFRLESDLIEYFKRVYYFSKRIAKLVIPAEETEAETQQSPRISPVGHDD